MQSENTETIFLREFTKAILRTFVPIPPPTIQPTIQPIQPIRRQITPPIAPQPIQPTQPAAAQPEIKIEGLEKLMSYIQDPSIKTIECPGPDKQIMINRNGVTQPTHITLTKKEIEKILDDFSEKTRIPIIPGIFKSKIENLIITAVVSDYVGTRFIIQKVEPKIITIPPPAQPAPQPTQQPIHPMQPQAYQPQMPPAQPQMPQQAPQRMPQRPRF